MKGFEPGTAEGKVPVLKLFWQESASEDKKTSIEQVLMYITDLESTIQQFAELLSGTRQWPVSTCGCKTIESLLFFNHILQPV